MSKVAIDIVLLPPKEIMDICFLINERAFEVGKGRFRMGVEEFVPHISLTLGCVEEGDLDSVIEVVKEVVSQQEVLRLRATGVGLIRRDDGDRGWLKVEVSDGLRDLHKNIIDVVSDRLVGCESSDVLVDGDVTGISETSKKILNNYRESYSYEKYNPHLSLCCFDSDRFAEGVEFPIDFFANEVAVFRIGDGCTCRELVWKGGLK